MHSPCKPNSGRLPFLFLATKRFNISVKAQTEFDMFSGAQLPFVSRGRAQRLMAWQISGAHLPM